MGFVEKLYEKSPIFLQNALISGYGLFWKNRRFGGQFNEELENYLLRESWSESKIILYQESKLRELLIHAFETVPYYYERYSQEGLKSKDLVNFKLKDLSFLPFLEKEDLREFGDTLLISRKRNKGSFFLVAVRQVRLQKYILAIISIGLGVQHMRLGVGIGLVLIGFNLEA